MGTEQITNRVDLEGRSSWAALPAVLVLTLAAVHITLFVMMLREGFSAGVSVGRADGVAIYHAVNIGQMFEPISTSPHVPTIYPPVYPAMVAAILKVTPLSPYAAARLVSLAAYLLGIPLVYGIVNDLAEQDTIAAATSAALFAFTPLLKNMVVATRIDLVSIVFGLGALYAFVSLEGRRQAVVTAVFCLLALYTKQSLVAPAVAVSVGYLVQDGWRRSMAWCAGLGVVGLGILGVGNALTDGRFIAQLFTLNTADPIIPMLTVERTYMAIQKHAIVGALAVLGAGTMLTQRDCLRGVDAAVLAYATAAGLVAVLTVGKLGANRFYFADTVVGLLLLAGITVSVAVDVDVGKWGPDDPGALVTSVVAVLLIVQASVFVMPTVSPNHAEAAVAEDIEGADGPVLTSRPSIAINADSAVLYEAGFMRNLIASGQWDPSPLNDRIRDQQYAKIVLLFDLSEKTEWRTHAWTPNQLELIQSGYCLESTEGPYHVYERCTPTTRELGGHAI